jgi:hypothetical protein
MADENQIIYKIEADLSDLIPELAKAQQALDAARKEQAKLKKEQEQATEVSQEQAEQYARATAETRRLADEARILQGQVVANTKVLKANIT